MTESESADLVLEEGLAPLSGAPEEAASASGAGVVAFLGGGAAGAGFLGCDGTAAGAAADFLGCEDDNDEDGVGAEEEDGAESSLGLSSVVFFGGPEVLVSGFDFSAVLLSGFELEGFPSLFAVLASGLAVAGAFEAAAAGAFAAAATGAFAAAGAFAGASDLAVNGARFGASGFGAAADVFDGAVFSPSPGASDLDDAVEDGFG